MLVVHLNTGVVYYRHSKQYSIPQKTTRKTSLDPSSFTLEKYSGASLYVTLIHLFLHHFLPIASTVTTNTHAALQEHLLTLHFQDLSNHLNTLGFYEHDWIHTHTRTQKKLLESSGRNTCTHTARETGQVACWDRLYSRWQVSTLFAPQSEVTNTQSEYSSYQGVTCRKNA